MFSPVLISALILLSVLDLFFLLIISKGYGIAFIIVTQTIGAVFGFIKLRNLDFNLFFFIDAELKKKQKIIKELWNEAMVLTGACLLIVPGYLTDLIGILFLVPFIRTFCIKTIDEM